VWPASKSWALAALALCAAEDGDGERAQQHATRAVALAVQHRGETAVLFSIANQALADARRVRGRLDEARHTLDNVERVTGRHPGSIHHALTLILRAELHLACHERVDARRAAADARSILARFQDVGILETRVAALEALLDRRADDGLLGSRPTAAEQRVLTLLAAGLTLEAIAGELFVSIHTVKSHTRRLYRRLGADNRPDAIAAARQRGLL
jgi:LuxR family maltose regulon positive regulatory protein